MESNKEILDNKRKELVEKLSQIGQKISINKRRLQITYNTLNIWKRDAYMLKCETENADLYYLNDIQIRCKEIELINLRNEIEWKKESLKDREKEQRELIFQFKAINRELTKLDKRIKKFSQKDLHISK